MDAKDGFGVAVGADGCACGGAECACCGCGCGCAACDVAVDTDSTVCCGAAEPAVNSDTVASTVDEGWRAVVVAAAGSVRATCPYFVTRF